MPAASVNDSTHVTHCAATIGVFDSGVGGLSVLKAIRARLPQAHLIYVADSGFAPYGERDEAFITDRCHHISGFLQDQRVDAIVVACNTATAVAVNSMRMDLPGLPIVGVEPGIKPAIAQSKNKRVGVLATPGTLRSTRFKDLVSRHGQDAHLVLQPCPGLAHEIERGQLDSPALLKLVDQYCEPLRAEQVDTVVLGCTHYPFIAQQLQAALGPSVTLLDTSEAVARRTASLLAAAHEAEATAGHTAQPGPVEMWTSGQSQHLKSVAALWLGWDQNVAALPR